MHNPHSPLRPAKPPRIKTYRALRNLAGLGVTPAPIVGTHEAVFSCVLVPVYTLPPRAADLGRVEQHVDFLAVVVGLRV